MANWDSIARGAIPAVIAILFALSRRYLPSKSWVAYGSSDAERFRRMQWKIGLAWVAVAAVFGGAGYYFLRLLNRLMANGGSAKFVFLPSSAIWAFFPVFSALVGGMDIVLRLWKRFGIPGEAAKYEQWSNNMAGFDATRVLRLLLVTIGVPGGIVTMLALPMHATVGESGFSIGHFGSLRVATYSFSEVKRILEVDSLRLRDGSLRPRPEIRVYFADGSHWSSADNREPDKALNERLLEYIKEKTAVPVEDVNALPFGTP